jgi:ribosomal protein S6
MMRTSLTDRNRPQKQKYFFILIFSPRKQSLELERARKWNKSIFTENIIRLRKLISNNANSKFQTDLTRAFDEPS